MNIDISTDASELGFRAAHFAAGKLNEAIARNGEARLVLSTGSSQFETLQSLLHEKIKWNIGQKIEELTREIRMKPVDLGIIGIGVNGHIAFNDPPADFDTREAYIVVNLDDQCRLQQVNEGWFSSVEEVPANAVSMTPWQIMQCKTIISCVPHKVKAVAVRNTLINSLTNIVPATMLKQHNDWHLFLDKSSSSDIIPL